MIIISHRKNELNLIMSNADSILLSLLCDLSEGRSKQVVKTNYFMIVNKQLKAKNKNLNKNVDAREHKRKNNYSNSGC